LKLLTFLIGHSLKIHCFASTCAHRGGPDLRLFLLAALLILLPGNVRAETDRGLAKCAAIESSVSRLACYDDLARQRDVAAPATTTVTKGKWHVTTETSKIDDSTNVYLILESNGEFAGKFGSSQKATLYIACRENKTDLYVVLGDHFLASSGGFGTVTYRIDKRAAKERQFVESTDNSALGLWNGVGVSIIKELLSGASLLIRVTPFNESSITVEFTIAGLEEAIKPLRKACGW
jgi:type VI secretion system protein VasI